MKMKKTNSGFTLIELLVVIAIIGLLATIVAVSLTTARSRARDAKRAADLKQIQTALELYYSAERAYPSTLSGLITANYLEMGQVPKDPSDRYYDYIPGQDTNAGASLYYHLGAVLENNSSDLFLNDVDQDSSADGGNVDWKPPSNNGGNSGPCTGTTAGFDGGTSETGTNGDALYAQNTCGVTNGGGVYDVGVFPQ